MKPSLEFIEEQYFDYYPIKQIKDYKIEDDEGNIFYINPTMTETNNIKKKLEYYDIGKEVEDCEKDKKLWGLTKKNKNHHLRYYIIRKNKYNAYYSMLLTNQKSHIIDSEQSKMFEKLIEEGLIVEYQKRMNKKIKFNFDKNDQRIKNLIFESKLLESDCPFDGSKNSYMYYAGSNNYDFIKDTEYPTIFSMDKYDMIKDIIDKYYIWDFTKFNSNLRLYKIKKNLIKSNIKFKISPNNGYLLVRYGHSYLRLKCDGDYYTFYSDYTQNEIKNYFDTEINVKKDSKKEYKFMEIKNYDHQYNNKFIQMYDLPNNKILIFEDDYDEIKKYKLLSM